MTTKKERASRLWFVLKFAYGVPDEVLDLVDIEEHADPTLEFRENLKVLLKRYLVLAQYVDDIEFKLDKADLAWRKYLSELQWLLESAIEGDESAQQELESLGFDIKDEKTVRGFIETLITEGLISKENAEELLRRWEEFVELEEKPAEEEVKIEVKPSELTLPEKERTPYDKYDTERLEEWLDLFKKALEGDTEAKISFDSLGQIYGFNFENEHDIIDLLNTWVHKRLISKKEANDLYRKWWEVVYGILDLPLEVKKAIEQFRKIPDVEKMFYDLRSKFYQLKEKFTEKKDKMSIEELEQMLKELDDLLTEFVSGNFIKTLRNVGSKLSKIITTTDFFLFEIDRWSREQLNLIRRLGLSAEEWSRKRGKLISEVRKVNEEAKKYYERLATLKVDIDKLFEEISSLKNKIEKEITRRKAQEALRKAKEEKLKVHKLEIIDTGEAFILKGDREALKKFEETARIGFFTDEGLEIPYATMAKTYNKPVEEVRKSLLDYIKEHLKATKASFEWKGEKLEVEWKVPEEKPPKKKKPLTPDEILSELRKEYEKIRNRFKEIKEKVETATPAELKEYLEVLKDMTETLDEIHRMAREIYRKIGLVYADVVSSGAKAVKEEVEKLIKEIEEMVKEKPKRTPTLEDILAELEPLGYKERWRVVELLKAKGFEGVGETIDRFIREGKLRKVGKYIEATKEVWREYMGKVAEEVKKAEEEEKKTIEEEVRKWIDEVKHAKEKLFKPISDKYHELEEVGDKVKEETEILNLQNEINNLLKAIDQAKEKLEQLLSVWGELHEKAINAGLEDLALDIRLTRQDLEARLKDLDFYKRGLEAFLRELNEKLREIKEKKPPVEEKPEEEALKEKLAKLFDQYFEETLKERGLTDEEIRQVREKFKEDLEKWKENIVNLCATKYRTYGYTSPEKCIKSKVYNLLVYSYGHEFADYLQELYRKGKERLKVKRKQEIEEQISKVEDKIVKLLSEKPEKIEYASNLEFELLRRGYYKEAIEKAIDNLIRRGVIERVGEYIKLKVEKPKEGKPPTKPPEPYDFVLEKLKSTFLAELELGGFRREEAERELETIMFELEKLARDVVEGELSQVDAVKEVIKKARVIARPPEVALLEEVKPPVIERPPEVVKPPKVAKPPEVAPPTEATEMAMRIKDVMESLGWKGVVELLKPHLPEIFTHGLYNFLESHKEWSLAIPPTRKNLEPIFRNLRRAIEQKAMEKYRLGTLTFREWLIGSAPETIRLPLLSDLIYFGYTSKQFMEDLRKAYENPEIQEILRKVLGRVPSFEEFYNAMIEFLRQYRL